MRLDGWRLIAITLDYPHHAGGSGYGRLARLIDFDCVITPPRGKIAKIYDAWVRRKQSNRLISRLTRRRTSTEVRYLVANLFATRKLVHVFYGEHHSWLLRSMRSGTRSRKVATIHLPPSLWHVSFKKGQLDRFDAIVLMSDSQIGPLQNELGYSGRIEVIPHGVDTARFTYKQRERSPGLTKCLMVGNFLRDFELLRQVASRSAELSLPIKFEVVGGAEAATHLSDLSNVTLHRGISDEQLLSLYHEADLAFFTMQDCTANNALLEAMSTGLPVVATDVGGVRTYVRDSFATLVSERDPDSYLNAIEEAGKPDGYDQRSKAARAMAERFDWEIVRDMTKSLYQEIIGH